MDSLQNAKNIGKEMHHKLMSVGVNTLDELKEIGSKKTFLLLKQKYDNICLVHLYTLEAAIQNVELDKLTSDVKKDLKEFSDGTK